jgi:hypothetical protein
VGAFLAFTLSQSGMVVHWRKQLAGAGAAGKGKSGIRVRQVVNGVGAIATGAALAIILIAKFTEGAWITILTIPVLLALFQLVHRHYKRVEEAIQCDHRLDLSQNPQPVVLVPIRGWTKPQSKALRFAIHLSPDVIGVHLSNLDGDAADDECQQMSKAWAENVESPASQAGVPIPRLKFVQTPYREFVRPMLEQIDVVKQEYPHRLITVILPELIEKNWLEAMLHLHRAMHLRMALRKRKDFRVIVIDLPWFVEFQHNPAETAPAEVDGPGSRAGGGGSG